MQLTTLSPSIARPLATPPAIALSAAVTTVGADATAKPAGKPPLFSNGLVNWASRMTPETLSAIFALNDDGTVRTDAQATPQRSAQHPGPYATPEENLLATHVRALAVDQLGLQPDLVSRVSDQQKQFFHATTGYNLVVEGDMHGVYDDAGHLVPDAGPDGGRSTPVWQLADSLVLNGEASGGHAEIDASWFEKWRADFAASGGEVPKSWAANAQKYFDEAMEAMLAAEKEQAQA